MTENEEFKEQVSQLNSRQRMTGLYRFSYLLLCVAWPLNFARLDGNIINLSWFEKKRLPAVNSNIEAVCEG